MELLRAPAWLFARAVAFRNALYQRGFLPIERIEAPVISVGNVSAGGTGKSPFVALLCRELMARGRRPGVASRGYKARSGSAIPAGDEAQQLAQILPGVAQAQHPERAQAARDLLARGSDVIVLDDGFQHRRLFRDLDFVLVDATRPWGLPACAANTATANGGDFVGALLPRGLLREPLDALARAQLIIMTRCDQVAANVLEQIVQVIGRHAHGIPIARARHRPLGLTSLSDSQRKLSVEWLLGRQVALVSAIGNPEAFQATIEQLGAKVAFHRQFSDHHVFSVSEAQSLAAACRERGTALVCTHKDAVKLHAHAPDLPAESFALEIEFELLAGREQLAAYLDGLAPSRAMRERAALHAGLSG